MSLAGVLLAPVLVAPAQPGSGGPLPNPPTAVPSAGGASLLLASGGAE